MATPTQSENEVVAEAEKVYDALTAVPKFVVKKIYHVLAAAVSAIFAEVTKKGMTVGLLAIVKDEASVVERMLQSAIAAGITVWCIVDTGSTDNTEKLIRHAATEYMAELHLANREWDGFSDARNASLALTQGVEGIDHWLVLDADEEVLVGDGSPQAPSWPSSPPLSGTDDLIHIPLHNEGDGLTIWASRILRHGTRLEWRGKVHEGLYGPDGYEWTAGRSEAYAIVSHGDGHRTAVPGLRNDQNYALAMEQLEQTPNDPRAIFYGAMAAEGAGMHEQARNLFLQRARMHNSGPLGAEEGWYAEFRAALMRAVQGHHEAPFDLLKAYARRPYRSEPLAVMALFWREQGELEMAKATFPAKRPWPVQDWLFVDPTLYTAPE